MWFELSYQFLGGLGLFFLGMKFLSESLQLVAGKFIRRVIRTLTTNRLMAVGVGTTVTAIVQSSSVTTVMVVGFVNAGLMELTQAIGVIMGANIGTTLTGWILAVKVGKYGPLLLGIGIFPSLFASAERTRALGKVLVALGLVFMGLEAMSGAFKPLRSMDGFLELLQYFSASNVPSLLACVLMGTVLTFVIQSSSAMLGITIALAATGTITFQTAVALVLGENIGTTITALIASVGTTPSAKRAARAHALFNGLGVLWLTPLFWGYLEWVDWLIPGDPNFTEADGVRPYIAAHIAAGHSVFNVVNTLVFLPFVQTIARVVTYLTPDQGPPPLPHLKYLQAGGESSPELALTTAEREVLNLSEVVSKSLKHTRRFVRAKTLNGSDLQQVKEAEQTSDKLQAEITRYLCKTLTAPLSEEQANRIQGLIRAADELESIADYCEAICKHRTRLDEIGESFSIAARKDLRMFFTSVIELFDTLETRMREGEAWDLPVLYATSDKLRSFGADLQRLHSERLASGKCAPGAAILFNDIVVSLNKIRQHLIGVGEAIGKKSSE